jgi:hypothetical protein
LGPRDTTSGQAYYGIILPHFLQYEIGGFNAVPFSGEAGWFQSPFLIVTLSTALERYENNFPLPAISHSGGHNAQSGSDLRSLVAASSRGETAAASRRTPK